MSASELVKYRPGAACAQCDRRATDYTLFCIDHWQECKKTDGRALKYGVACVAYYGNDVSIWPDHEFDELCAQLLDEEAWVRVPWLSEDMLRAGSGYDLFLVPQWIHRLMETHLQTKCVCVSCARNGEN